ncbi:exodeoxyribonuclease III [Aquabacterium sp.]|uniref:exodeoxyribonuclease III n=1 Tax=Aquabacterium sp. TaxID=1872578 RepID=UPI00198DD330|nr:exodeoxyribonuclease III [Aquabacterium sp.]MBC7699851.1 exodeoxyribonuclease III [Aquabacterium sp.]
MFRLVSLNLNGIRSAANKGLIPWAEELSADCMGVQELKAQAADLTPTLSAMAGMRGYFHHAEKKGYSGVGLYSKHEPSDVLIGLGTHDTTTEFDAEGRWVEVRFDKPGRKLSLISCYFPSGSSSDERQQAKFRFLGMIAPHLARLKAEREYILVGDVNIAHHEKDLKNWKGNLKNSGFLPEERAWMTTLLDPTVGIGLVDVYRQLHPETTDECYTWWSNRGQARAKNVGWRIDYQLATPGLAAAARHASVFKEQWFSDHAPLTVDYDFSL